MTARKKADRLSACSLQARNAAQEPWLSLLAWADSEEEQGGCPRLIAGLRWLARLQKFPAGDRFRWWWMEPRASGFGATVHPPIDPDQAGSASSRLPWPVIRKVRERLVIGCKPGEFRDIVDAWFHGAIAVGGWLEEKPKAKEES